jgi:hypothetical protein
MKTAPKVCRTARFVHTFSRTETRRAEENLT